MNLVSEIISAIVQIAFLALIPFLTFLIKNGTIKGFSKYIGLKRSSKKANLLAIAASLLFASSILLLAIFSSAFRDMVHHPTSITGKFKALGISPYSIGTLLIIALFKTALAEEILFRGFIAKRLISATTYQKGNVLQALIFGLIHALLFALITSDLVFLSIIVIITGIAAYVSVYLNEKVADGSIVPGWISHALGNVIAYSVIGFVL